MPNLDPLLNVRHRHCDGAHFLFANPHTFPGRMSAWCERESIYFSVSKGEVEPLSSEGRYWIAGFLAGNEPRLAGDAGREEEQVWYERRKDFAVTGEWPPEDEPDG